MSRAALLEMLCGRSDLDLKGVPGMSADELRTHVRGAIENDFAAGRLVVVDGWMLAETEVVLSALVALPA